MSTILALSTCLTAPFWSQNFKAVSELFPWKGVCFQTGNPFKQMLLQLGKTRRWGAGWQLESPPCWAAETERWIWWVRILEDYVHPAIRALICSGTRNLDDILLGLANTTWVLISKLDKCTPVFMFYCKHFDTKVCCLRKRCWTNRYRGVRGFDYWTGALSWDTNLCGDQRWQSRDAEGFFADHRLQDFHGGALQGISQGKGDLMGISHLLAMISPKRGLRPFFQGGKQVV